jgi:N-acetylmuramoyl-L-alanine amidase
MTDKFVNHLAVVLFVLMLSTAPLTAFGSEIGRTLAEDLPPAIVAPSPEQPVDETLKGKVIVLDAGHGGTEVGAQRDGIDEKDLTLQLTLALKACLEAKGANVILTRAGDSFVSLEERVNISNQTKPDIFVSVHINSMPQVESPMTGVEVYYRTPQSKVLAIVMQNALVSELQAIDRGIGVRDLYVVHHTIAPSVLCEVGFLSNSAERALLVTPAYQQKIVDALSAGITTYLTSPPGSFSQVPAKFKQVPTKKNPVKHKPTRKRPRRHR